MSGLGVRKLGPRPLDRIRALEAAKREASTTRPGCIGIWSGLWKILVSAGVIAGIPSFFGYMSRQGFLAAFGTSLQDFPASTQDLIFWAYSAALDSALNVQVSALLDRPAVLFAACLAVLMFLTFISASWWERRKFAQGAIKLKVPKNEIVFAALLAILTFGCFLFFPPLAVTIGKSVVIAPAVGYVRGYEEGRKSLEKYVAESDDQRAKDKNCWTITSGSQSFRCAMVIASSSDAVAFYLPPSADGGGLMVLKSKDITISERRVIQKPPESIGQLEHSQRHAQVRRREG